MRCTTIRSLLAVSCLRTAFAQYAFSVPEPNLADFHSLNDVIQGSLGVVTWVANTTNQPTVSGNKLLDADGNIYVWLTSFESNAYTHCIAPSVNSEKGGTISWTLSLSDDEVDANGGKFLYRLKPTVAKGAGFNVTEDECPSRGFTIRKSADVAASSSASVASAASASRAAASKTKTSVSASTTKIGASKTGATSQAAKTTGGPTSTGSLTPAPPSSTGLSGSAKAGIAIGAAAIAGVVAIAIFLVFRRCHSKSTGEKAAELSGAAQYSPVPSTQDPKYVYGYSAQAQNAAPVELPNSQRQPPPVELPAVAK